MKKIISWNVNGIRAVEKKGFSQWLKDTSPDVLCIQETKARKDQLENSLINIPQSNDSEKTYYSYFASAKRAGYSGVAIYSKEEPISVKTMGISDFDDEGRVLIAEYKEFSVISAYFPNSQEAGARLPYKLAFCNAIKELCADFRKENKNFVLCGDYNVAHKPIDLKNPNSNEKNPGYLPEERSWMDSFLQDDNVDTFREFCKEPNQYTWWSYRFHAREKNVGWRIDYHCVNKTFLPKVASSTIMADVMGSDHCPICLEVR